ncbi:MAG: hypothetical protein EOO01_39630 [Chitinophagaceae bacterium]|nr:MAG: hypothetical protein EOO01_39630 [Chitinophagaceae bacterium]
MEQRLLKFLLIQLKVAAGLLLLGLLCLLLFSFTSAKLVDDFWTQLGLSKARGSEHISTAFVQGYLDHYGAKNAKNIAVGNRSQVVTDLGNYARQYVKTDDFLHAYRTSREQLMPLPPPAAKTIEMVRAELVGSVNQSIKTMDEFLKSPNADLKKMAQDALPGLKKQLKEYADPNSALIKLMADGEKMNFETQTQRYLAQLAQWEKEQPADPKLLIRNRLREFLEHVSHRNGKKLSVPAKRLLLLRDPLLRTGSGN